MTDEEKQEKAENDNILVAKFMGYTIEKRHFQYKSYNSSNEYYWANSEDEVVVLDNNIVENYEGEPVMNFEELAFHQWDTLMAVVFKIGNTMIPKEWTGLKWDETVSYHIFKIGTGFSIGDNIVFISDSGVDSEAWANSSLPCIERTYLAVIEFINWYNAKKKKP